MAATSSANRSRDTEARLRQIEDNLASFEMVTQHALESLAQTGQAGNTDGGGQAAVAGIGGDGGGSPTSLAGDVTGPAGSNLVERVQHQAFAAGTVAGQLPSYDGTGWVPTVIVLVGDVTGTYNANTIAGLPRALFDHFADVGNAAGETDLYSDTLAAGRLSANGQKILAQYGGTFAGSATSTQRLRGYFGGTLIFDSGALSIGAATDSWDLRVTVIRESASVVRCSVTLTTNFATLSSYATYTRVTGLTLANTQILKITGEAAGIGAAVNQVVASEGYVEFRVAA